MFSLINSLIQYCLDIKLKYPLVFDNYKIILAILGIFGIIILGCLGLLPVWVGTVGQLLAGIGLFGAAYIAYKRLIHDAQRTALLLGINSKIITNIDDLVLTAVNIKLKNSGVKRIYARQYTEEDKNRNCLFSSEGVDVCKYAGTLKIRRIPNHLNDVEHFDWYSLEPITDQLIVKDLKACLGNFEQINYLDEFGKEGSDRDVNFFIEANEQYNQQVVVILTPGLYAIKAFFLGEYRAKLYAKLYEEYWSCTKIVKI